VSLADAIWADVARVRLQDASGRQVAFGSGRLIGLDLVLTARHVAETDAKIALPDDGWEVRLLGDRDGDAWAGDPIPARLVWRAEAPVDLCLLRLVNADRRPAAAFKLRLARYDRETDIAGVWLAGFPDAARQEHGLAREYAAPANLRRAADRPVYRVTVAAANAPRDNLDWRGCSGGVVLLRQRDTLFLLGVLAEVPRSFGGSLDAVPIMEGLADATFRALLAKAGGFPFDDNDIQRLERLPGRTKCMAGTRLTPRNAASRRR
jgi:hypothetical protein